MRITNIVKNYLKKYEKACFEVFEEISRLEKRKEIKNNLDGPVKKMSFGRLND